jgi:microcystin-dependent protein
MTKEQVQALITANLPDNDEKLITPEKVREVMNALIETIPEEQTPDDRFPKGIIAMWSGAIADIPAGFVLCDGRLVPGFGYVPDLRGKFIAGYYAMRNNESVVNNDLLADYGSMGAIGGAKQVTLTVAQIPPHTHSTHAHINNDHSGNSSVTIGYPASGMQTGATGGGLPHENRPPYYVLAYIIKVTDNQLTPTT